MSQRRTHRAGTERVKNSTTQPCSVLSCLMNQGVDEQMEHAQTVTWLTKASTNKMRRWHFNLLLAVLTVLLLKPETEGNILLKTMNDSKQRTVWSSWSVGNMPLWPWRLSTLQNYWVSHSKEEWYLQQRHFHDQVDEVGQQFLQEILAVCFYTRGRGRYYETHMADPSWSKIVSFLGAPLPWQSLSPSSPSSIFHAECTVEMALMEIS